MAFENKTIDSVYEIIIDGLQNRFNMKFRLLPKAFITVMAKVVAGIYITLYKQQAWIFLQIFAATASYQEVEILGRTINPLMMWGDLGGVAVPRAATQFEGKIRVTVKVNDSYISQGTQFLNPNTNKLYYATDNFLINTDNNLITVRCTESGEAGNLNIDDELMTASPLSNIERKVYLESVIAAAVEAESEESYRNRVIQRWQNPPQGGALGDYRQWSNEVEGVAQSYIYKDDNSAAGVIIYIKANSESRIADNELLINVGKNCEANPVTGQGRKPIGAIIDPDNDGSYKNIKPCYVTQFDVWINDYESRGTDSFRDQVKIEIENYFLNREPFVRGLTLDIDNTERISVNNVLGIVNDISISNNGNFSGAVVKLNGEVVQDYTLDRGELAKLGHIYVNGEEV